MRQLFLNKGNLVIKEVAQPLLHESSLLIAVHYAYITPQTDLSNIKAQGGFLSNIPHKVKRVLEAVASHAVESGKSLSMMPIGGGYSCAGRVISVGKKVTQFAPGDFVACSDPGYSPHADLVCVPENCAVKVSNNKYLKQASLISLAAIALQGVRRADIQIGEWIGVFGLNIIGLLTVQLAKIAGCSVVAIDETQERLALATKLGADITLHTSQDEIQKEISLVTEQHGLDAIFLSSHEANLFDYSIAAARKKGKLILVCEGIHSLHQTNTFKDLDIIVAGARLKDDMDNYPYCQVRWTDHRNMQACLTLLEKGLLSFEPLVEKHISIQKLPHASDQIQKLLSVGIVLSYEQIIASETFDTFNAEKGIDQKEMRFIPAVSDVIRVGIIGGGDFTQSVITPHIAKIRGVKIVGISDENAKKTRKLVNKYNTARLCTKEELLISDMVDVVVIASFDAFHAEHALQALQHGKAVFLEKPMVTDFSQLQRLVTFLRKKQNAPFCVDYSYSFSPFAQKIKMMVKKRRTPLMAHYRINRELMNNAQGMEESMGAGRIIGDTCQIIDLFCYLTDAQPISISVEAMHSSRDDIFPTDNVSTQIAFNDGSVCSFLYTTLGHADMGAERMEIYYDGKVIVMEDYMELYGFGLSSWFNETIMSPDKGHEKLISQFFTTLQKDNYVPPITVDRLYLVAHVTLLIDQLACEGGGKKEMPQL